MNDSSNTNPPPPTSPSSSSEPESDNQSFLSWGAARQSKEYTQALSEIPSPNCTQQIVQQATYAMPATLNYVQQQQQQSQQQQSQQQQQFDGLGRGMSSQYTRHNSRGTSQERSTTSSSEAQTSPTPFRPMQPKEFSLGNNLRRPYSNIMMPLPNLPADIGSTSGSGSFEQGGGKVGGGGSGSVGSGGNSGGGGGGGSMSILSSSGWRPKKKKKDNKSSSSASDGINVNANAAPVSGDDNIMTQQDTTTIPTTQTQQTSTAIDQTTTTTTQLGSSSVTTPPKRSSYHSDSHGQESLLYPLSEEGDNKSNEDASMSSGFSKRSLRNDDTMIGNAADGGKKEEDNEDEEMMKEDTAHVVPPGGNQYLSKQSYSPTELVSHGSDRTGSELDEQGRRYSLDIHHVDHHQPDVLQTNKSQESDLEGMAKSEVDLMVYEDEHLDISRMGRPSGLSVTDELESSKSFSSPEKSKSSSSSSDNIDFITPIARRGSLPKLPEKRSLKIDPESEEYDAAKRLATATTIITTDIKSSSEAAAGAIPTSLANVKSPQSVSTISPNEQRQIGSLTSAGAATSSSSGPLAATARFGKLLQECRELTETCGDGEESESVSTSSGRYDSSYKSSSHPSARSLSRSKYGDSSGNSGEGGGISSRLEQQKSSSAAGGDSSGAVGVAPGMSSVPPDQQEIDTSNELKVSNLTMDPAIQSSLRSQGSMTFRPSDFRPSFGMPGEDFTSPNERDEEGLGVDNILGATSSKQQQQQQQPAVDQSQYQPTISTNTIETFAVPIRDNAQQPRSGMDRPNQGGLDKSGRSGISDLSLGVDLMYGDTTFDNSGNGGSSKHSPPDDETASFNPEKFMKETMMMMNNKSSAGSVSGVSELSMNDDAEGGMLAAAARREEQDKRQFPSPLPADAKRKISLGGVSELSSVYYGEDGTQQKQQPSPPLLLEEETQTAPIEEGKQKKQESEEGTSTYERRVFQPREETELKYSWLSYTTNGDENEEEENTPQHEEKQSTPPKQDTPPKQSTPPDKKQSSSSLDDQKQSTPISTALSSQKSPLQDDELVIQNNKSMDTRSSFHSTEFSEEDRGGLLVGFGRRRPATPASEASSISSSSSETSSDESGFGSSSSSSSSGSEGSSSSSSSSELTSSSEESSMPASRLHIPSSGGSVGDDVSALSFGGASALMALQSMKHSYHQSSQGRMSGEGGSGTEGGSGSKSSSEVDSPVKNELKQQQQMPLSPPSMNFQPSLGRVRGISPAGARGRSVDRRAAALAASQPLLDKLDEVSESNASFLDDISSIGEPNPAVQMFLAKTPDDGDVDDVADSVWSSFRSESKAPSVAPSSGELDISKKSTMSSSESGKRKQASSATRNNSGVSGLSLSIKEDSPLQDVPPSVPDGGNTLSIREQLQMSTSRRSQSSNSSGSLSRARPDSHISRDSHSSGSYYEGVVARAREMESNAHSASSDMGSSSGAQDAGINTIESVRSTTSTSDLRQGHAVVSSLASTSEYRSGGFSAVGTGNQGSGESPLENVQPNQIDDATTPPPIVDDGVSSMNSSVVSKARDSLRDSFRDSFSQARSRSFSRSRISQPRAIDTSASSRVSGLSEHSKEKVGKTEEPIIVADLPPSEQKGSINFVSAGKATEWKSIKADVNTMDQVAINAPLHQDFDKVSMISGDDDLVEEGGLYEDFPSREPDDGNEILRKQSSSSRMLQQRQNSSFTSINAEETNWRKPWQTAAPEATSKEDVASIFSQDDIDTSQTKVEPKQVELKHPVDHENSSHASSELFESKETLKRMGLYKSVVPDQMDANISQSSSNDSSSVAEWIKQGSAKMMESLVAKDGDDIEKDKASSRHSMDMVDEEEPELIDTSQENKESDTDNEMANKSSVKMLAATANEMTELLRSSMLSRSQKTPEYDEVNSQGQSIKSGGSVIESLKSFGKMFNMGSHAGSQPASDNEDERVDDESNSQKGNVDDESSPPAMQHDTSVEVSSNKSLGGETEGSDNDINMLLKHSFRKVGSAKDLTLSPKSDPESLASSESSADDPRSAFGYKPKIASAKSLQYDNQFDASQRSVSMDAVMQAPNPFLDESSSDEDEESGGLPPVVKPFSGQNNSMNIEDNRVAEENLHLDTQSAGKGKKSRFRWYAMFGIVVLAILIGVAVSQKKKNPAPSEPSNPSVTPPSPGTQTAPPTRLPTPLPTIPAIPNWVQVGGELVGEAPGDEAGFSVSVSEDGSRAVVGARRNAKDGLKNRGSARIYEFDSLKGFYVPIEDIYGEAAGDQFGFSVSMSKNGKRIAVGSLGSDKNGQNAGATRVFDEDISGNWILVAELLGDSETSLFGSSVSLSSDGSSLVVGAPYHSEGDTTRSGRSYVYREVQESVWEQVGEPIFGTSSNDLFGWSVSSSPNGQFVAVGAPRLEGSLESGYVKVFYFEEGSNSWELHGETITNEMPGDRFGFSVSLAGNETLSRIGIGAPGMSANGEGSGMASVYDNVEGNGWFHHLGDDVLGFDFGDNLGYSVSMTPDGTRIVIGVPNKQLNEVPVGQVQVVDVNTGSMISAGDLYGRDGEKFGVSVSVSYEGELVFGGASMANLVRVYGDY